MKAREAVTILQGLWLRLWWQSISVQRAVSSSMPGQVQVQVLMTPPEDVTAKSEYSSE